MLEIPDTLETKVGCGGQKSPSGVQGQISSRMYVGFMSRSWNILHSVFTILDFTNVQNLKMLAFTCKIIMLQNQN